MKKVVIVTNVSEVKQDNGEKQEHRNYRTIEISTPSKLMLPDPESGNMIPTRVAPRRTSINVYEESYLNNEMEFGYDVEVGERVLGDIVTRRVTPYKIPVIDKLGNETEEKREVSTYTTVVFGDSEAEDWDIIVKNTFHKRGHEIATPIPANFSIAKKEEEKETEKNKARVF